MSRDYEDEYDDRDEARGPDDRPPTDQAGEAAAANRTNAPGIFLIVSGVLNVLGVVGWAGLCVWLAQMTPAQFEDMIAKNKQGGSPFGGIYDMQIDQLIKEKTGKDPKDLPPEEQKQRRQEAIKELLDQQKGQILWQGPLFGVLGLLAAILPILGGARMRSLRSYGLSVTGAIVTAVPCLSCASCPCGIGLIFGIWALVVLLNPDVKNAFR
jgi:hypothetical protein